MERRAPINTRKEKFWQNHIRSWQQCSCSQKEYCRRNGLARSTFSLWRRKLKTCSPTSQFYPLVVPSNSKSESKGSQESNTLVLVVKRFRIEIPEGFSGTTLIKLLTALEEVQ